MPKAAPTDLSDLGVSTREAARVAARRAGVPVGQWLDRVISERAADLGVRVDDIDPADRLDALTARLAQLAASSSEHDHRLRSTSKTQPSDGDEPAAPGAGRLPLSATDADGFDDAKSRESDMDRGALGRSRDEADEGGLSLDDRDAIPSSDLDEGARRGRAAGDRTAKRRPASDRGPARSRISAAQLADLGESPETGRIALREGLARGSFRDAGEPGAFAGRPLEETLDAMVDRLSELESRVVQRDYPSSQFPPPPAGRFDHLVRRALDAAPETVRLESTFRTLDERLSTLSRQLEQNDAWAAPRSNAEIERIDGKLASILARLNKAPVSQRGRSRDTGSPHDRSGASRGREDLVAGAPSRMREAVADIARRQADLEHAPTPRAALLGETSYASIGQAQRDQRIGVPAIDPDKAVVVGGVTHASIDDAFKALSERLEARLDQAAKAQPAADRDATVDFAGLQGEITALGDRLDRLQSERARDGSDPRVVEMLETLRGEVVSLGQSIVGLAARTATGPLEEAVRNLAGRVEVSRLDGIEAAVLAPVERLSAEIRESIAAHDPRAGIENLGRELKSIAWNIETMQGQRLDEAALQALHQQTQGVREAVIEAAKAPPFAQRIEAQLGTLGERLERLSEAPTRAGSEDLTRAIADIHAMIERSAPDAYFERIDRKMDDLAIRIEGTSGAYAPQAAMFDDLSRKIEDTHASLAARLSARSSEPSVNLQPLETLIGGLSEKIDTLKGSSVENRTLENLTAQLSARVASVPTDLQPLENMISGIDDKISTLHGNAAEMRTLDTLIRGLMLQIEEARLPSSDARVLDALESQVGRLAERLDRSDASMNAISSLERAIGDLFQELEETRNVAMDAAEHAARTAAQDTLRAVMSSPSINGKDVQLQTGLVVEQVSQELSEFRRAQDASEKRVHGTLKSLSSTLERLVDRMIFDMQAASDRPKAGAAPEQAPAIPKAVTAVEAKPAEPIVSLPSTIEAKAPAPIAAEEADLDRPIQPGPSPVEAPVRRIAPSIEIGRAPTLDVPPQVSPLIAAARRAAQAAQTSAAASSRPKLDSVRDRLTPEAASGSFFVQKRRPLLLGLAGVVLLLGAIQIARLSTAFHGDAVPTETTAPATADKPETKSELPADKADGNKVASTAADATGSIDTGARGAVVPSDASLAKPKTGIAVDAGAPILVPDPALSALSAGLRDLAMRGDAAAQYEVAIRLADGRGVTRDLKAAAVWFERAAKQGLAPAQYRLGSMYEKALGVAADPAIALSWYERAATQGNIRAMHNLAVMSAEGSGSKPDYAKAVTWFTKAANAGVRDSQYNLAILYARGLGVTQSLGQAYAWFAVAAGQGDVDAGKKRDEVAAKLDAKALADAKALIDAFKPSVPERSANEVAPPSGGWDVASPAKSVSPTSPARDGKAHSNDT